MIVFVSRLWIHEIMRVFYDRLIEHSDRQWLFNAMRDAVKDQFKENFDMIMSSTISDGRKVVSNC